MLSWIILRSKIDHSHVKVDENHRRRMRRRSRSTVSKWFKRSVVDNTGRLCPHTLSTLPQGRPLFAHCVQGSSTFPYSHYQKLVIRRWRKIGKGTFCLHVLHCTHRSLPRCPKGLFSLSIGFAFGRRVLS